jgi:hypothetical protein
VVGAYEVYWGETLDDPLGDGKDRDTWRDEAGNLNVEMGKRALVISRVPAKHSASSAGVA